MRVFLDANVIFSAALNSAGGLRAFFQLATAGVCELLASPYALDEARRNMARKQAARVPDLDALILQITRCREASADSLQWALATGLPAKDAPILAAAVQAHADILATGDRAHFGMLFGQTLRGVTILTPREALERILATSEK